MALTVQVDPNNSFTETNKDNNKATIPITVNGSTLPNLTVSYKDIVITPSPAIERGNATISMVVKNEGFSEANNVKVAFHKGVPGAGGVLIGNQVLPAIQSGHSAIAQIDWPNINDSGERIIYIQVDPDNTVQEISRDDNSAFTTLEILSLPDLVVSPGSIAFNPAAPKDGEPLLISVTVQNAGKQDAVNVPVEVRDNGVVIETQTVPLVKGSDAAVASFSYVTTGKRGVHAVQVTVDPDNTIAERSKDNNRAEKSFTIQNTDLWLSEPYFSPNGDGVKDTTDFFFRLEAQSRVKLLVVNAKGETVRTFAGGDLDNTTAATVTWDGLNDKGTVVDDGEYRMAVVGADNGIVASLAVVVDTNRSPLYEALGTNFLLDNNLTCKLPSNNVSWLPDESGLVYTEMYSRFESKDYRAGIYTMSPDGSDIVRITPEGWTGLNPTYDYEYNPDISPDGQKIIFSLRKQTKSYPTTVQYEIWMMDIDGNNLFFVDNSSGTIWSPDSNNIIYGYNYIWLFVTVNG